MWALGCVAYEMLSGYPAFDFANTLEESWYLFQ